MNGMRFLHLVRHARSQPTPGVSAHEWPLMPEGEAQAADLARHLRERNVSCVVTSVEPKAHATGRVIARELGVTLGTAPGLHEQERSTAPFYATEAEFTKALAALFTRPAERVFGEESADEAHARFRAAVNAVMEREAGNVVVVAHGTVNSLLVARANNLDVLPLWRSLAMPDLLTLAWPTLTLAEHFTPGSATRKAG